MMGQVPDADAEQAWFLAQIKPNSHRIAQRNLDRQGFRNFLPMLEETARAGGRFVRRARPLFPGYLFVALDPEQGRWRTVNATSGLTRLVSFGSRPQPVPPALVQQLQTRCDAEGLLRPVAEFAPDDRVLITSGPFAQFVARIESMAADQRVWVLLDLLGSETRMAVEQQHLRRAI